MFKILQQLLMTLEIFTKTDKTIVKTTIDKSINSSLKILQKRLRNKRY